MILVTGATGFIGRHLVSRLLADGQRVRCLIPENELMSVPWEGSQSPEIIQGNVLDEEMFFKAVTGAHVVIHLENAQWWGRPRDLERIELVGTRNLIAAARAARVGRIITLSHLGAAPSSAYPLMRIKGMVEEAIRSSGVAYTIIRSMPGRGEVVLHPIYIDDVIETLVRSLELVDTVDTLLEIGGPEYITLEDFIRTVMRVSGMPRLIIPVPPYMLRWVSAIYSRILPRSLITPQWLDILATNRTAQLGNAFNYFGIRPRRFEDTLVTYMRGKRYWLPLMRNAFRRRPRGI
jgi:NADH dehydrogenase